MDFLFSGRSISLPSVAYLHGAQTSNSTHKPNLSVFWAGVSFLTLLPPRFFQFQLHLVAGSPFSCHPIVCPLSLNDHLPSILIIGLDPAMSFGAVCRSLCANKEHGRWRGENIWLEVMERWQAKPGGKWRKAMKATKLRGEWRLQRGAVRMSRKQKKGREKWGEGVSWVAGVQGRAEISPGTADVQGDPGKKEGNGQWLPITRWQRLLPSTP